MGFKYAVPWINVQLNHTKFLKAFIQFAVRDTRWDSEPSSSLTYDTTGSTFWVLGIQVDTKVEANRI